MRRKSRVSHDTRLALPVADLDERHPGAKNVEELVVRVKIIDCSPTLYPYEEAMERLADVIPIVFPNLRYVYFQRETRLSDEALQRLSDRLKKMEYLSIAQYEEARTRRHN
ncbi:hypothetical protein KEM55_006651 [Ascosphaera atra]|nr:hypothetical protein KEM55_006651 [Ascosphaera atra]